MQNTTHSLRLCHIHKWDHFEGYGFNLHAEKGKPGQYIGKVDEGSPAEAAGLKEGDRIIEVNGINIAQDNHKQVVQKIKALKTETKLLVVDHESEAYFKSQNITLHGGLTFIVELSTPLNIEPKNNHEVDTNVENEKSVKENENDEIEDCVSGTMMVTTETTNGSGDIGSGGGSHDLTKKDEKLTNNSSLRLNMTAKELRAQLAARPRYDPKTDSSIDLRKKYDIVQKL